MTVKFLSPDHKLSSKAKNGALYQAPASQHLSTQHLSGELMNVVRYRVEQLGLNVALQLLVGVPLEMVHGATRIGLVYVAGVVAGEQAGPEVILLGEGQRRSRGWYKARLPAHTHSLISRVLTQNCPPGKFPTATQIGRCIPEKGQSY